ncbi:MAG: type II secretion system F family protein [Candidatus Aenigmatarchaeota archaeon]
MIYERLIRLFPKRYRERMRKEIVYAGLDERIANKFIGFSFIFSILLFIAIGFDLWLFGFGLMGILIGLVIGIIFIFISNISIILIADSRGREVEKLLPDVLQLISANVRAGMTVDKAIWLSARPEFGILEEEVRKVGAKTMGGKPINLALKEMSKKIKSKILDRTVKLIIEGIESGGELAKLLDETSSNIRTTQSLRKEIRSSVMMYSIFILFAAVLGAPMLYAISLYFVEVMTSLWAPQVATGVAFGGLGLAGMAGVQITTEELFYFAIVSITITTLFGSLLMGLIQHGQEKRGLKYLPFLVGGGLAIFFIVKFVINILLGGLFIV